MSYKVSDAIKRNLQNKFEEVCNGYLLELCNMWDINAKSYDGFWVGDEIGGTFAYGETLFINMDNIKYCVENNVSHSEYMEWLEYCVWASEFNQYEPNLKSWHNGCPRVDEATQEKLSSMKYELEKLIEKTKKFN